MTELTVAALQLAFGEDVRENIRNVSELVREAAFCGERRERVADAALRLLGRVDARIEKLYAVSGERCDLGDAGAHRTGAEDRHRGRGCQCSHARPSGR